MKNNYKVYGNERTNLTLSDKAQKAYGQSTYTITENEDGSYAYYDGAVSRHNLISDGLTAEEMNELLEQEYEDQMAAKAKEEGIEKAQDAWEKLLSERILIENADRFAGHKSLAQNYTDYVEFCNGTGISYTYDPDTKECYASLIVDDIQEDDCYIKEDSLYKAIPGFKMPFC